MKMASKHNNISIYNALANEILLGKLVTTM